MSQKLVLRKHSYQSILTCACLSLLLYATLDFVKFIVSICEQTNDLSFTDKSAFWTSYFFFLEIMLESWGCGLYTSLYGNSSCRLLYSMPQSSKKLFSIFQDLGNDNKCACNVTNGKGLCVNLTFAYARNSTVIMHV